MYRASGKPSGSLGKPAEESAAAEHEKVARLDSSESQQTVVDTPKQSKPLLDGSSLGGVVLGQTACRVRQFVVSKRQEPGSPPESFTTHKKFLD